MTKPTVFGRLKAVGFTLVEIMIVVLIIGILLAIAIPNFMNAREEARAKACVANLKQIDSATQQWAMDNKVSNDNYSTIGPPSLTATSGTTQIVGSSSYIRSAPSCPSGGTYSVAASLTVSPTCSIPTTNSSDTNYQLGGRYYHGL